MPLSLCIKGIINAAQSVYLSVRSKIQISKSGRNKQWPNGTSASAERSRWLRLKHDWKPVFTNRKMEKCVKSCTDLYDLSFLLNRKSNPIALCHIIPQKSLILDKHWSIFILYNWYLSETGDPKRTLTSNAGIPWKTFVDIWVSVVIPFSLG